MKGLLLKDLYTVKGYFKLYLGINVLMIIVSAIAEENLFVMLYPCLLSGIVCMSLLAYEDKEKWNVYALTLPFTRAQAVSSKYLLALIMGGGNAVLIVLAQLLRMLYTSSFDGILLLETFFLLICASLAPTAMLLPFLYKFGVEKGRLVYILSIGAVAGILGGIGGAGKELQLTDLGLIACVISALLFALSWWISIKIYKKKEL